MSTFHFKHFSIIQTNSTLKVGTDAMLLGAHLEKDAYTTILDIGTSTGVLALMAKQLNLAAVVTAIDIDEHALIDCKINFENSTWNESMTALHQDLFSWNTALQFDCIVCNPPYYENGLTSSNHRINQAKHTVNFSIEALFNTVKQRMKENGVFWIILPVENADKWVEFATSIQLFNTVNSTIFGTPNSPIRSILKFEFTPKTVEKKQLTIRDEHGNYTPEYKALTKNFHAKEL